MLIRVSELLIFGLVNLREIGFVLLIIIYITLLEKCLLYLSIQLVLLFVSLQK